MIRKAAVNEYKPWLNINKVEILINDSVVSVDTRDIGLFKMSDFKEAYENCLGGIRRLRYAGYVMIELHRSLIGEIEFIYNNSNNISGINVFFEDGHQERFNVDKKHKIRVTSLGDLRVEIGELEDGSNEKFKYLEQFEYSSNIMFPKNWGIGEMGLMECLYGDTDRVNTTSIDQTNHEEIIIKNQDIVKDVLGEIVYLFDGKNISKERLIALATIADYYYSDEYSRSFEIKESTYWVRDKAYKKHLHNFRLNNLKFKDYAGRRMKEEDALDMLYIVNLHKHKSIEELIETIADIQFDRI